MITLHIHPQGKYPTYQLFESMDLFKKRIYRGMAIVQLASSVSQLEYMDSADPVIVFLQK
jgi:hypothetical protein